MNTIKCLFDRLTTGTLTLCRKMQNRDFGWLTVLQINRSYSIHDCKQAKRNYVMTYNGLLKQIWDEIASYVPIPGYECKGCIETKLEKRPIVCINFIYVYHAIP